MEQVKTDLSNLPTKELCERIDNCLLASEKFNDDCLLSFCYITVDQLDCDVDKQLLFHTC